MKNVKRVTRVMALFLVKTFSGEVKFRQLICKLYVGAQYVAV